MPLTVKCPTCRDETAWENNPHRPFCSERCQLIDLGAWLRNAIGSLAMISIYSGKTMR